MYYCLVFQTLPKHILVKNLPKSVKVRSGDVGLNICTPLYNSSQFAADKKRELAELKKSADPVMKTWLYDMHNGASSAQMASLEKSRFVLVSQGQRAVSKKAHLFRGPENEDEATVDLVCSGCGQSKMTDPNPIFRKADGRYIAREQWCKICPVTGSRKLAAKLYHPVDGRPKISMTKLK